MSVTRMTGDQNMHSDRRFKVSTMPGVAFWLDVTCETHFHCVLAVMVGDDRRHHVDLHDITLVTDYCTGCGQIGCGGDGRDG